MIQVMEDSKAALTGQDAGVASSPLAEHRDRLCLLHLGIDWPHHCFLPRFYQAEMDRQARQGCQL